MLSKTSILHSTVLLGALSAIATPASAQGIFLTPTSNPAPQGAVVCTVSNGQLFTSGDITECDGAGAVVPDTLSFSSGSELETFAGSVANFGGAVNFSSNNVSFNTATVAFGGGTATFNNTVSFTGPSATFSTPTTFQNPATFNGTTNFTAGMTTTNITNSGGISTSTLTATTGLTASAGANINMGGNQIHGVAAGTAATDAVNVAQLNAATSGITADVTALETTTATHTTQIATLETTTATHTTQIAAIQTVNTTQATQITALQAADTVFDTRIDTLELLAEGLDERIDKVDDRASAGTAAAVALSGAMFLPGKSFNLTGNVGSYRGAHAAALQFGALVSDNVAVNAGIAHGFNKGGKTALRAGFTIGW